MPTYLITGGTGFVGSHAAEAAVVRGKVLALARSGSDTTFLESIGAQIVAGDLTDPAALRRAAEGIDCVIHCAAKVGDWGAVEDFRTVNVGGLRNLFDALRGTALKRFVYVSSLGVYEARHHYGTDETEPLPAAHIDGYTQSKVECETLALEEYRKYQTPVTIVRPGFIYGPRDRTVLPRLADRLRKKSVIYIARGRYALNTTYVGNLVDAIFLAAESPRAVGEVFNVTDGEFVSKRRFFEAIADGLGLPRPKASIPLWLARPLARWRENVFRRKNKPYPPLITRASVKFAGLNLDFSIAKARTVLGYDPQIGFDDGMKRALEWVAKNKPAA
ncbi:NAD-dependent epimerase/dehydratase family protein [Fimbriiglobus ruber]|uniref:NAD-dependent epimerase/dehydratase n=1 Tax=Fimbriiglobus ruber TaxID=1908690 RepID=A0A225EA38_9BACT|nr:NAD-dependent epimerase/dehydratase family protein [Fimbriiglobus ruber]OWK46896.1 NAD-dependent epimerase/dehydratase [Fimbriiglobus ruber]